METVTFLQRKKITMLLSWKGDTNSNNTGLLPASPYLMMDGSMNCAFFLTCRSCIFLD